MKPVDDERAVRLSAEVSCGGSNGRCLDCGKLVPNLPREQLEAAGWHYFGNVSAQGFVRHNWRCDDCMNESLNRILRKAKELR